MRAVLYGRVNRPDQVALERQFTVMREFCGVHGIEIVREESAECSGRGLSTILRKMMEDSDSDFDAILVQKASRIARDCAAYYEFEAAMRRKAVQIITVDNVVEVALGSLFFRNVNNDAGFSWKSVLNSLPGLCRKSIGLL